MKRWLFGMQGGLEPSRTIGPVRTRAAEQKSILRVLREFPDLLAEERYDTLHWIELQKGRPVVGSYAAGLMEDLRAQTQPSS